jgi:hypothetical protein
VLNPSTAARIRPWSLAIEAPVPYTLSRGAMGSDAHGNGNGAATLKAPAAGGHAAGAYEFATEAIHGGQRVCPVTGAVFPPIYTSST